MVYKKKIGQWGEDIAEQYYRDRGFTVVARNWRCRYGELDLVCVKGGTMYAVEVKARRSLAFGFPEEAVDEGKQERIMRSAEIFLEERLSDTTLDIRHHLFTLYATNQQVVIKVYTSLR